MDQLLGQLPLAIALLAVIAIIVYSGFRVGPRFLIRRLTGLVFVLFGVTFITFILGYLSPGDPLRIQCGDKCTTEILQRLDHLYGLDLPWYQQYWNFLTNLLHFNLGRSYATQGQLVWDILRDRVPVSLQLSLSALVLQLLIGIPIGIFAAVRAGSRMDTTTMSTALIFYALPTFVTIPFFRLAMVWLSLHNLPYLPVYGWGDLRSEVGPIFIITLVGLGFYARLTRTTMLDVLGQDYVRTARAKGVRERTVIIRHAFRNALVPLVTAIGPAIAFAVSGAFFTEFLFNIPGIGFQAISSISNKDMPVVQGTVIIVAVAVAMMNLVVDIVYGILDPRIKVA